MSSQTSHCGFIAIVGRPNVGKSTLLNKLVGLKISITSRKAQTTRHKISGIRTEQGTQYIFVDTPGFQLRYDSALNRIMNHAVKQTLTEVDVILWVVEACRFTDEDKQVLSILPQNIPVFLAINKIDKLKDKAQLLPFIQSMTTLGAFKEIFPISAKQDIKLADLLSALKRHLPEGPILFDEDAVTDRDSRFLAAEMIREKILRFLGEEVPYAATVTIDNFQEAGKIMRIAATVLVDKPGQKAILIGNQGAQLKKIASESRQDMEKFFGSKVFLEVWVKVKHGWAGNEKTLRSLGYDG